MAKQQAQPTLQGPEWLAGYLDVPVATIYAWRSVGKGPRAYRVGKHLRYRQADVEAWLEEQADPVPSARRGVA